MYLNHLEYHCAGGIFPSGEQNPARGDGSDNVYCFFSEVRKDAGEKVIWKTVNGKRVKTVISEKAVDGCQLYKSLCTIRDRYEVRFEFCTKEETGRRIVELLS